MGMRQMDKREADDPCFYLLAIWSPGMQQPFIVYSTVLVQTYMKFATIHK